MIKGSKLFVNILSYIIKTTLGALLPLLMYKYASRVLGVNAIGLTEYVKSIVSYFALIASAGITTFAIRDGVLIRGQKKTLEDFVSRIYGINIITMLVAYLFLLIFLCIWGENYQFNILVIIYSSSILLTTIGLEWIYNIYEKFVYMTIRSILFNLIAFLVMLIVIKKEDDVYMYMGVVVFASFGCNVLNRFLIPKLVTIKARIDKECFSYIKPICVLFFNNIATTIYVSADTTMVGYISGTYRLGLYSASINVYNAFKKIVSAVFSVLLPHLTYEYGENFNRYINKQAFWSKITILIAVPVSVGIAIFSRELILILSSANYIQAYNSLNILAISFFISTVGVMINATILLPKKMENYIVVSTSIGAILNICLNVMIVPRYAEVGAAATTALSELVVVGLQCFLGRDILKKIQISIKKDVLPCMLSILIVLALKKMSIFISANIYIRMGFTIIMSMILYSIILFMFDNSCFVEICMDIEAVIKSRLKNNKASN